MLLPIGFPYTCPAAKKEYLSDFEDLHAIIKKNIKDTWNTYNPSFILFYFIFIYF
tara:strand:+ start:849 stop:1013 length:165 start_codon:yes stop_codon:yes gene_type:complete